MGLFKSLTQLFRREHSVTDLAKWLDLPEAELREWLGAAPMWSRGYDYARFTLPKRRGGTRAIEAPNDKLKALQRRILQRLLNPLPMHPAATGFVRGRSIVDNARPHIGRGVVINLDLADFFFQHHRRARHDGVSWIGLECGGRDYPQSHLHARRTLAARRSDFAGDQQPGLPEAGRAADQTRQTIRWALYPLRRRHDDFVARPGSQQATATQAQEQASAQAAAIPQPQPDHHSPAHH